MNVSVVEAAAEILEEVKAPPSKLQATCDHGQLRRAVATVGRAATARTTLPVLAHVLLSSDGHRLRLGATNLETGIVTWVPASIKTGGQVTVPAKLLGNFLGAQPAQSGSLSLTQEGDSLAVVVGRSKATFKGIDPEEFPPIPTEARHEYLIPADKLRRMIGLTAFAASTDESRPVLTGVHLTLEGDTLALAAADGFRLSQASTTLQNATQRENAPESLDVIVPAKALQEVARLLSGHDEEVVLAVTEHETQLLFRVAGGTSNEPETVLVTRLLEGPFPDLLRIIPKEHETRAIVSRTQLLAATKLAALFARDSADQVCLRLDPSPASLPEGDLTGRITVRGSGAEVGELTGDVDAVVTGNAMTITFASRFVTDVLSKLTTEDVVLDTVGPTSPASLRGSGLDGFTHVIMPMHVMGG